MRQSELFTRARREAPADEVAKNAKLLIRAGFIHKEMAGVYSYLPLGLRVLKKLENLIRDEIVALGAQEVLLPALQPKDHWLATGRWNKMADLYKLKDDSGREFALGPTHEEVITPLARHFISSYQDLPFSVFQFQTKFRMEPRAKSGLLRSREFLMKDLYSFHRDAADLARYYKLAIATYKKIFQLVGLSETTYLTLAGGGTFSEYSHEFQTLTPAGEDLIGICQACRLAVNDEIKTKQPRCPNCGKKSSFVEKSIEVGNIFQLGTTFSNAFNLVYRDERGANQPVVMGCFGLGVSRLLGALAEIMSDERGLIWPAAVAPFKIHLLTVGGEDSKVSAQSEKVYGKLVGAGYEVLWDDRPVSAGEKLAEADLIGLPYRLVVSKKTLVEKNIEVSERRQGLAKLVPEEKICDYFG